MQMRVTQFNDLEFKNKGNKILIVEKVMRHMKYFPCHGTVIPWVCTHSYAFNEDTNLLIRKLYMQAKVYIQFQ